MSYFPRQDLPESQKTLEWVKLHLTYAEGILQRRNNSFSVMDRLYQTFNGIKNTDALRYIEKTYGRANKSKFISYRLGRNKLELLRGEWLNQPLKPSVTTINSEARIKKLDEADVMRGAIAVRQDLQKLKEVGVDVMEGMEIPEGDPDEVFNAMSFKDKNEHVMQIILDNGVKELDLKHKLSKNLLDVEIASMCYGKIDIDEEGNVNYLEIDPRDAIFDEIQGDDFLERSPLKGARFRMTVSEVMRKYKLTKEQRDIIKNAENNSDTNTGVRRRVYKINGDLCVDVVHVEWISLIPIYSKLSPKTQKQMEIDSTTDYYKLPLDTVEYESNKEYYDKLVEKGKLKGIQVEWAEDIRHAVRIAGVITIDLGRKKFQTRRVDNPSRVIDMSYVGYLFNTVDGIRISMQQIVENFDSAFDICMYQILKELNAAKGKTLVYNRAAMPQGRDMKGVIYDMVNDGFIDLDTSADGNESGTQLNTTDLVQVLDVGLSSSFQQLLLMKQDLINTLDLITGINENRQGDIKASSTVTNAQFAISASKNITGSLFYGMTRFVEKTLMKICEAYKISYAFYKVDRGRQILGDAQQRFIEIEKEIGYADYGVYIEDSARFMEWKQQLMQLAEASLNSKQFRMEDVLKLQAAESFAEGKSVLRTSWATIQRVAAEQQQRDLQAQQQMQQQQLESQRQMAIENREDLQAARIEEIITKGKVDLELQRNGNMDKLILDTNNAEQKQLGETGAGMPPPQM